MGRKATKRKATKRSQREDEQAPPEPPSEGGEEEAKDVDGAQAIEAAAVDTEPEQAPPDPAKIVYAFVGASHVSRKFPRKPLITAGEIEGVGISPSKCEELGLIRVVHPEVAEHAMAILRGEYPDPVEAATEENSPTGGDEGPGERDE